MEKYYEPMTEDAFDSIKAGAIIIWQDYDDTYGYATGKIDRIKDIKNISDNGMYIIAMFDQQNQRKLKVDLPQDVNTQILERYPEWANI